MERMLLRQFQQQILLQSRFMLIAAEQINEGLRQSNITFTFYALQSLLNNAANIAKALWGSGGRHSLERQDLRDSIGILDTSPLKLTTMRNNFEHYDDRLDKWWALSKSRNHVDLVIAPRDQIKCFSENEMDWFRIFDPKTTALVFWGQEFCVQDIINEVLRILPKLEEEASKPHSEKR